MSMEVITTTDKEQRDRMFQDLRKNGNEFERQVVKFSGCQPVLDGDGQHAFRTVEYYISGSKNPRLQIRWMYESTWSVAYPRDPKGAS